MKCPYCNNGIKEVLLNYEDFHIHGYEPITEKEPCEDCDGSGEIDVLHQILLKD